MRSTTPLTALLTCILVALAAYAFHARRRHLRLEAACREAFDHAYASTSPRPAFEMSYSYGEPAFEVRFASQDAMTAAASANAAFLGAIDEACRHRGRKRQFKAQRAVFFQHPPVAEETPTHCCATMRAEVSRSIAYSPEARTYGLRTSKIGTPAVPISHCPWCGTALPPSAGGPPA